MANRGTVIQEFFARLGFVTDRRALRNFNQQLQNVHATVMRFAATMEDMALTVVKGLQRMTASLEGLYFASQRTGASAASLTALERAAQNFGVSADEALGTMEALASSLRDNPGKSSLIESWGIHLQDAKGRARDLLQVLIEMGRHFSTMPFYLARRYAALFGIDERSLMMIEKPGFAGQVAKYEQQSRGMNAIAAWAHQIGGQLRDLGMTFQQFAMQIYLAIEKRIGDPLRDLNKWLKTNGKGLAKDVADGFVLLLKTVKALEPVLESLWNRFKSFNDSTHGWAGRILGLIVVMKLLGADGLVTGVLGMAGALLQLGLALAGLTAASELAGIAVAVTAIAGGGAYILSQLKPGTRKQVLGGLAAGLQGPGTLAAYILANLMHPGQSAAGQPGKPGATAQGNGPGFWSWLMGNLMLTDYSVMQPLRDKGFTETQLAGVLAYFKGSALNQSNPLPEISGDVQFLARAKLEETTRNLLKAAQTQAQAEAIMKRWFDTGSGGARSTAKAAGHKSVHISQETNIHVSGSGDPHKTAQNVARAQDNVHRVMTRNFAAAMQ